MRALVRMASGWTSTAAAVAYRAAWRAAWPVISLVVRRKDRRRGVLPSMTAERFGWSQRPAAWEARRAEFTLWIHGASVGECLSVLPLVELALAGRLSPSAGAENRRTRVLLTTTTPAARALMENRLTHVPGQRALCVFAPLDHPACVQRFLETWQPDAGLWIESELWPTLITEAKRRRLAIGLVNARMSPGSHRLWQLPVARGVAQQLLDAFSLVMCQDKPNRQRFLQLGAARAECAVNLKFANAVNSSAAVQGTESDELQVAIGKRPVWAAVSTHDGEEELMAAAHIELAVRLATYNLLAVIIPRHPERAPAIVEMLQRKFPNTPIALRSKDSVPSPSTAIFIVDTLGETRLFFNVIRTVVMGGTFVRRGGHNPLEPLHAGCQVLVGPHMENFADIMHQLQHEGFTEGDLSTRALHELPTADVSELVAALHSRLLAPVDGEVQQQQTRALATLARVSLSTHERKLREWLASSAKS